MLQRESIQQLMDRCDIEDIISSYAPISKTGRKSKCLCPFHSEKTPSFVVYPENQSFYCFGCGAGGDVISFIMRAENLDYLDAVKFLARRIGYDLKEDGDDIAAKNRETVYMMNKEAARFFHKCLKLPVGAAGYEYFKKRELSDKIINKYGLGYAPNGWNSLRDYLNSKGFSEEQMLLACLVQRGKSGRCYDLFRNRVIFPIIDTKGNVIGFGGRVLDDSKPKYLNSPDTVVFKKSRNLFSLNFAKTEIKENIILAEGYMDVIAIYAAGFKNVVATLGTSLTEEQARIISKYTQKVIIAYDSDGPGQAATMRASNLFSQLGLQTKVINMEGAKDPDEYIKKFGTKRFEMLLNSAGDIVARQMERIKEECDMETSAGKINFLKRTVGLLSDIQNPLEREVYAAEAAEAAGTTLEAVKAQLEAVIRKKKRDRKNKEWRDIELGKEQVHDKVNLQKSQFLKEALAEEGIISFLFKNPDYYSEIDKIFSEEGFVTDFNRRVYSAMRTLHMQGCEVNLSLLAPMFTQNETAAIAAIIARSDGQAITKEMLNDYIGILLKHKSLEAFGDGMDAESLEKYRQKIKSDKTK